MNNQNIEIDGLKINVTSNNEGKECSIVFIHGNSLDGTSFTEQLTSPLFKNYNLYAVDLPGHGESAIPNNPEEAYSVLGYRDVVQKVIESLGLKQVILVGHSLGGHVAIELSATLSNIKGMVVFGTPPIGFPPAMDQMFLPNPIMGLLFKPDLNESEENLLCGLYGNNKSDYKSSLEKTDAHARSYFGGSVAAGKFSNEIEQCQQLTYPLLMLHGDKDELVNLSYLEGLRLQSLYEGKVKVIGEGSHSPQLDNVEKFNTILDQYLQSLG